MRKIILLASIILLYCPFNFYSAQQFSVDSLRKVADTASADTTKIQTWNELSAQLMHSHPEEAMQLANNALELSKKIKFNIGVATALNQIGLLLSSTGKIEKALQNFQASANLFEKENYPKGLHSVLHNIGLLHQNQENYEKALEYYQKSLSIQEQVHDELETGITLTAIGSIYCMKGNFEMALEYFYKGLESKKRAGNKSGMAVTLMWIGYIYNSQKQLEKALVIYKQCMELLQETKHREGIANAYNQIGNVYQQMGMYAKALENFQLGLTLAQKTGYPETIQKLADNMSYIHAEMKNFEQAYQYHLLYSNMKDSLLNVENSKQITEMQTKYETEKKELLIENLHKDNEIKTAEIKKQNIQKLAFASGFALMLILAYVIFRGYKQKQKANEIILAQKTEVEKQKAIVDQKNKEILDSIHYAKRIQEAILPPQKLVQSYLENSFILYKPKDIVAGDFYWMQALEEKSIGNQPSVIANNKNQQEPNTYYPSPHTILFACCDCTGHGVPGAFVSILGYNALNRCTKEFGLTKPSAILDKLCELFDEAFAKSELDIKDGMDMALCAYVGTENFVSLQYAGAGNSLYLVRKSVQTGHPLSQTHDFSIIEYPADKQPIGKFAYRKPFTNHEIPLQKGDTIYIFTDGYPDQFGGPKGKKFRYSRFEQLLISIQDKSMTEQRDILHQTIEQWRGNHQQIDDICIIGVLV